MYINPPFNTFNGNRNLIEEVITKIAQSLKSNLPTRVVLLIPIFEGSIGQLYETQAKEARFLEIATFPKGSFSFIAPEHYHIHNNFQPGYFSEKVGLYLCANKASLKVDPLDWETMLQELLRWSHENTKSLPCINDVTRQKFAQRVAQSHSSRSVTRLNSIFMPSSNFFHYYDYAFPQEDESQTMKTYIQNARHLELISGANRHDRLAGTLGILPNHLIQLLRLTNHEDVQEIIKDLRFVTFWSTYSIWAKRQKLNRIYWKIIPECCRPKLIKKNKTKEIKRIRRSTKAKLEVCQNPFHYLNLKKNLGPIAGTCNCTLLMGHSKERLHDTKSTVSIHKLLRTHSKKRPPGNENCDNDDISGLDFKHNPSNRIKQLDIRQFVHTKSSADIVREEQDRKKRFKF
jgi:hypothetical protein